MKQRQISYWLKALCILLGIMGVLFFGAITAYASTLLTNTPANPMGYFIIFTWYTALLCYGVLFLFWKVCTQIGDDNSFSLENALAFRHMGFLGIAYMVGQIVRLICLMFLLGIQLKTIILTIFMLLIALIFVVLCECLSQLVKGAYEMKQENELTI